MRRYGCESIRPLISAFMDGELTPEETRALHAHLAECADCSELFDEYRDLRDQLRHLPPTPPPPEHVRRSIRERTVEHAPSRAERWFGLSAARLSFSAAAAVVLLIVVSAFGLIHGVQDLQHGGQPAVASSQPTTGAFWPIEQPILITFSKPMDQASVDQNLKILPLGEATRLPRSWRGNTLEIGASPTGSVPLLANTDYTIVVLGTATDAYGNPLGQPWILQFHTSAVLAARPSPTPTHSPVATRAPQVAQVGGVTPTTTSNPPVQSTSSSQTPQTGAPPAGGSGSVPTAPPPTSSASPASPTPTVAPTPTPQPTTASVSAPATPTPRPSASPTTAPTAAPATPAVTTPTATPTTAVTGAFGSVYWGKPSVQAALGTPKPTGAYSFSAAILSFQRGTMYERFDTQTIYIFFANGTYKTVPDTWAAADGSGGGQPQGQANLWIPTKSFWNAWTADATLVNSIGYATSADAHYMQGQAQDFAGGTMLYSDTGFVYVVYTSTGKWEVYPDTSGQGALLTPTPGGGGTPSATPAVTSTATPATTPAASPAASPAATQPAAVTSATPSAMPTVTMSPTATP